MTYYDPPDPIACPACHGDAEECGVCQGEGCVSESEYREYIADARAEMADD